MRRKCLSLILTLSLLLTIPVWAAKEESYQSRSFSNMYATLTIDKTRELERQEGGYIIYGVPADAQLTVTVHDTPETVYDDPVDLPIYIGTAYSLTENNGNANTGGLVIGMAESVLVGDTLTPVYRSDGSSNASLEDNSWVGRDVRKIGTYTFNLNSADFVGWEFSPLCGTRMERSPMPGSDGSGFHGFLGMDGGFYGDGEALVDFQVEAPVNAKPSADAKPSTDAKPSADTKTSYQSRTFSNAYATLTIDKTRELERKDGGYTIYGVPADAKLTVTITDAPDDRPLYIGASYTLMEGGGNANTGGLVQSTVESVLIGDTLTPVYRMDESKVILEDNSWVGRDTRKNGTCTFSLNAVERMGWNLTPLCGTRMEQSPMPDSGGSGFHGFLGMDGGFNGGEDDPLVSFRVEAATDGSSPTTSGGGQPSGGNSMQAPGFEDVAVNSPYRDAIYWAVEQEITNGTTPATFSPNDPCTKAQILTFLWRSQKEPASSAACPVPDVDANSPYYKALCWAGEKNMIGKTEKGSDACTRSTAVTYLWKLADSPKASGGAFTDVPKDAEYAQAVAWAVSKKITTGKTADTFVPDEICSRGQIVTFLYRAYSE